MTEFDPAIGYKVVRPDMTSLGLRRNPNILTFTVGQRFTLNPEDVVQGKGDWGGIWVARTIGSANKYIHYMREQYQVECRIFATELGQILFRNQGRVKTDSVLLFEELPNPPQKAIFSRTARIS